MPNADQNPGIDPKYLSMQIIADQCWLIGIARQWSVFIGIGINAASLIGIVRYLALIGGVLRNIDLLSDNNILSNPCGYVRQHWGKSGNPPVVWSSSFLAWQRGTMPEQTEPELAQHCFLYSHNLYSNLHRYAVDSSSHLVEPMNKQNVLYSSNL